MSGDRGSGDQSSGRRSRVVEAHTLVAPGPQLLSDRRSLYRLAAQMAGIDGEPVSTAVMDDPISRFRIGEVIAGRTPPAQLRLRRPDALAIGRHRVAAPAIASSANSADVLAPALRAVAFETGDPDAEIGLITEADTGRFPAAADGFRAGVQLARALVPELLSDVIDHVTTVGLLDPERCGTVVSASSRYVPGLVLLRPGGPLDVAESVVHEAAHQRFFDMAITRDLLRADADSAPGFRPSWRQTTWPVEQTLAAFHAYACLTELAAAVPPAELASGAGLHSVLPEAGERATELGAWLVEHSNLLGTDADRLVRAILGRPAPVAPAGSAEMAAHGSVFRAGACVVVPAEEHRCLVGVPGSPFRLFWLDADAAAVLEILKSVGPSPLDAIERAFAGAQGANDISARLAGALDTLVAAELAIVA
jgi:hypothetical protein